MPTITESDLKKVINKGNFGRLYYLCGEEKVLVSHYTRQIVEKTCGREPNDFNYHVFTEKFSVEEFEMAVQIMPFMSKYNVVVVKDIDFANFKDNEPKRILDTVSDVPEGTILIVTFPTKSETQGEKSTGGANDKKLKSIVSKVGTVAEFSPITPATARNYLMMWAKKSDVIMNEKEANLLVDYCGTDLNRLKCELSKLCSYVDEGGTITCEDIETLVTRTLESNVFELSNAIISRRADDSFKILNRLLYAKEEPVKIISVLAGSYMNIYRVRMAIKSGERSTVLKQWFKITDYQLRFAERDSRNTTTAVLRKSINAIAETDMALKSTRTSKSLLLELLIEKLLIIASEGKKR